MGGNVCARASGVHLGGRQGGWGRATKLSPATQPGGVQQGWAHALLCAHTQKDVAGRDSRSPVYAFQYTHTHVRTYLHMHARTRAHTWRGEGPTCLSQGSLEILYEEPMVDLHAVVEDRREVERLRPGEGNALYGRLVAAPGKDHDGPSGPAYTILVKSVCTRRAHTQNKIIHRGFWRRCSCTIARIAAMMPAVVPLQRNQVLAAPKSLAARACVSSASSSAHS